MKRECEIARDLMPLCVDEAASEGSQEFVAAHAAGCRECAQVYSQMREALAGRQEASVSDEQVAQRIRRHVRARRLRSVLIGLAIGLLVALCGLLVCRELASRMRPMAVDRYELNAYSRPNGSMVLVLRAPGLYGYKSWQADEDGRSILYVTAERPMLPGRESPSKSAWVLRDRDMDGKYGESFDQYDEIRQGTEKKYRVIWTRGEKVPACSETFEAFLRNQEEQSRSAIVQDEDFSYTVGDVREGEAPIVRTKDEWDALREEGARLKAAAPELQ